MSSNQSNKKLPGTYIAGFVDGEGCFSLFYRKDIKKFKKSQKIYYEWKACFAIVSRIDDANLLKNIKDTLNIGSLYLSKRLVQFRVSNLDELYNVVMPFFNKYKLRGKKREDFKLWSEAVNILYNQKLKEGKILKGLYRFRKKGWNRKELIRLNEIREKMKKYKSMRSKFKYSPVLLANQHHSNLCPRYFKKLRETHRKFHSLKE
jgi:hypothetical protein